MAREDLSGRKTKNGVYRSGEFKKARAKGLKTSNLTKAQLKRAQTARGKKVGQKAVQRARKNVQDISSTQFEKGRGVTRNGKLFTGTVTLASGKKATYVRGRRVVASRKPTTAGGRGRGGGGSSSAATSSKATRPPKPKDWLTASRIGGYTPGTKIAGSGKDGVNAATSSGSARTSDYVHDSFSSYWQQPASGSKRAARPATTNRPSRGERMQLTTDASGKRRWIKVV